MMRAIRGKMFTVPILVFYFVNHCCKNVPGDKSSQ
jgi:hypothetical protein